MLKYPSKETNISVDQMSKLPGMAQQKRNKNGLYILIRSPKMTHYSTFHIREITDILQLPN